MIKATALTRSGKIMLKFDDEVAFDMFVIAASNRSGSMLSETGQNGHEVWLRPSAVEAIERTA